MSIFGMAETRNLSRAQNTVINQKSLEYPTVWIPNYLIWSKNSISLSIIQSAAAVIHLVFDKKIIEKVI